MNRYAWSLVILGVLSAGRVAADPEPAAEMARLAKQRSEAARRTYEVWWANYHDAGAPGELVYRWSVRWLEAERQLSDRQADQVAAFQAHADRMLELSRLVEKRRQASRQITIDEITGAEFYRAEADLWLLQAKEKEKKGR
jgi:hypothetical protein